MSLGPAILSPSRGSNTADIVAADFDGNGRPDLVYAQAEVERVLLNHMDGSRTNN